MPCMPRSQPVQPFKIRLWLWINRPTKCYQFVVCAEFDNNCRDDRHETAIHPMDSMRCTADCVASISAHSNTTNQIGDKQLIKNNRASCSIALLPKNASKFHWICSDHCEPIFWMRLLWRWADWQSRCRVLWMATLFLASITHSESESKRQCGALEIP